MCVILEQSQEQDPKHTAPSVLRAPRETQQHPPSPQSTASTEPSTTSNTNHCHKLVSKGGTQPAPQQAAPVSVSGLERYQSRSRTAPVDGNITPSTQLCCRGEQGGFPGPWPTLLFMEDVPSPGCVSTEHETHNFTAHFPSPPTGNFSYILEKKKTASKQPSALHSQWFPSRLPSLRSCCQCRAQPGLFRQPKSGLTSSPLECIKECKKGENWEIF